MISIIRLFFDWIIYKLEPKFSSGKYTRLHKFLNEHSLTNQIKDDIHDLGEFLTYFAILYFDEEWNLKESHNNVSALDFYNKHIYEPWKKTYNKICIVWGKIDLESLYLFAKYVNYIHLDLSFNPFDLKVFAREIPIKCKKCYIDDIGIINYYINEWYNNIICFNDSQYFVSNNSQ